jgi:Zn-dependent protease
MGVAMTIQLLLNGDHITYFCIVSSIMVAVVLHELAHGLAAIWEGDQTPIELGHMTANPLVHMGPFSLGALFIIGIAWGAMPVNPSQFRHRRYGDALVSLAGPVCNLLQAAIALVALGLWKRYTPMPAPGLAENGQLWLLIFGWYNIALAIFNLAPVPPLDGSRIMSSLNDQYRNALEKFEQPEFLFMGYFFLIMALEETTWGLFSGSFRVTMWVLFQIAAL